MLTDLPGLTVRQLDGIAKEEQVTFEGLFETAKRLAAGRMRADVLSKLRKRRNIRLKETLATSHRTTRPAEAISLPASAHYRGMLYEFCEGSLYETLIINRLEIYAKNAGPWTLLVHDLVDGLQLYTFTYNLAQGWNVLEINQKFIGRKIFVGYDGTAFDTIETPNCGCDGVLVGNVRPARGAIADGIMNIRNYNESGGLIVHYAIGCDVEALVCQQRHLFANAWLYLLGIQVLTQQIYSPRTNHYTTVDADRAKELRAEWQVEYEASLETAIRALDLMEHDKCYDCTGPHYEVRLP